MKRPLLILFFFFPLFNMHAENGYRLWLRYDPVTDAALLKTYRQSIRGFMVTGNSETGRIIKEELKTALEGLLNQTLPEVSTVKNNGIVIAGTFESSSLFTAAGLDAEMKTVGKEGFLITSGKIGKNKVIFITGKDDAGVLYGVFHFLRVLQTHQSIKNLKVESSPKIKLRVLDHWDNLNGTIERGYAGSSLWDWKRLPDSIDRRYIDYARANASVGINGTALNNVNANQLVLTTEYLQKVAALANTFRPYGIKVYLSVRFSSPKDIGKLSTADPLDPAVQEWWKNKAKEIYSMIPDFGGFLVKANSEGQPGPQNYKRTHAEGANMLADALKPFGGIVMWRAFVYDNSIPEDRAKQALNEFKPLDGQFRDNVLVQVKNGPIDFQPREPFHPLFGAMPGTPLMMEFQITQEYLGQATQLAYLAPLFKECLESDTYAKGEGSTVAKVIDRSLENHALTGIAGVANTGKDMNWTGHLFGQANWYAFGRLAWDHSLSAGTIAGEWIRMTFSNNREVIVPVKKIMLESRENMVNYMEPLGLHHIMGAGHHYGPMPWNSRGRADWTSTYYHKADSSGIGFERTEKGSNAVSQYFNPVAMKFANLETCPDEYLLWFHHLPWNYRMKSGKTLWEELCLHFYTGVEAVREMEKTWEILNGKIDKERFEQVKNLLGIQEKDAVWWRNACLLYFQTFSGKPIPAGFEKPDQTLDYYKKLTFPVTPR